MNLEKYKWKSRILFVSTPNYKEKKYLNLKKIYQDRIKEFHKRHIKLICKTNKKSNFSINLIGFDGKSKKKLDKLDYKLVFKTVDKMPLSRKAGLLQRITPLAARRGSQTLTLNAFLYSELPGVQVIDTAQCLSRMIYAFLFPDLLRFASGL